MEDVVIVSGCRTAIGRFQGSFSDVPASDLAAHAIREAVNRAGIDPELVEQVVMGIVGQVAEDAYLSRHAAVKAGLPIGTPAMNVNRICGSGLEAINTASRLIQSGDAEVVVAGGAENMTRMPFYLRKARTGYRLGHDSIEDGIIHLLSDPFKGYHMGITAENLAEQFEVSRAAQDELSAESQRRALNAIEQGYFKDQIAPMTVKVGREEKVVDTDEHPRATTAEALGKLRPAFKEGGVVTAGNASGINDGAAAVLLMSAEKADELQLPVLARIAAHASAGVDPAVMGIGPVFASCKALERAGWSLEQPDLIEANELGLKPRMRIVARAEAGVDPSIMGSGPIPAVRKALEKSKLTLDQIDTIELNEAFASVACACSN